MSMVIIISLPDNVLFNRNANTTNATIPITTIIITNAYNFFPHSQSLIMKLSKKYAQFVHDCFNYDYFHKYTFNYGDNKFRQHKITFTPLPAYIQTQHALHAHDWMGYVRILIDNHADESWFTVTKTLYGSYQNVYTVVEYNGWKDVFDNHQQRIYNSGPNDTPVDVFWLFIVDMAYAPYNTDEIERIFRHAIWFYICEEQYYEHMTCVTNNHVCPYYTTTTKR
ncbi:ORF107 [Spodoptera frugiperda granulovirus]|uniref:ORF107 n=1 Tax=Spodoptera frugiperda granulovirus TaxID=307454 RepID=A0A0C5AUX8_9BBAC|nr:ORF107 [Spodoptera frugiperda granulovirus]AJK91768.1 ORF107 [Spodoptera frugiperda granulovirus]